MVTVAGPAANASTAGATNVVIVNAPVKRGRVASREAEQRAVVMALLNSGEEARSSTAVALVGPPNVGKSTVAAAVMNDADICAHFPHRLWLPAARRKQLVAAMQLAAQQAGLGDLAGPAELLAHLEGTQEPYLVVADGAETSAGVAELLGVAHVGRLGRILITARSAITDHLHCVPIDAMTEVEAAHFVQQLSERPALADDTHLTALVNYLSRRPVPLAQASAILRHRTEWTCGRLIEELQRYAALPPPASVSATPHGEPVCDPSVAIWRAAMDMASLGSADAVAIARVCAWLDAQGTMVASLFAWASEEWGADASAVDERVQRAVDALRSAALLDVEEAHPDLPDPWRRFVYMHASTQAITRAEHDLDAAAPAERRVWIETLGARVFSEAHWRTSEGVRGIRIESVRIGCLLAAFNAFEELVLARIDDIGAPLGDVWISAADAVDRWRLGEPSENRERAIALLRHLESAPSWSRQSDSVRWARVQRALARMLGARTTNDRAQAERNREAVIRHLEAALEATPRESDPWMWAAAHYDLAMAYGALRHGDLVENRERMIAHLEAELEVNTRRSNPESWASTQATLAKVYRDRPRGDRATNEARAIALFEANLTWYTRENYPFEWVRTHFELGVAHRERRTGDREENQELSIAHFRTALEVCTRDFDARLRALTELQLGIAFRDRIRGDRAENQEAAIAYFLASLEVHTRERDASVWALTHSDLGLLYRARLHGDRAENLERALAHLEAVVEVRTRESDPREWAVIQFNLGDVYDRRLRGDREENVERAIAHLEAALEVQTRQADPMNWAADQYRLGLLHLNRTRGSNSENVIRAIEYLGQAQGVLGVHGTELQRTTLAEQLAIARSRASAVADVSPSRMCAPQ